MEPHGQMIFRYKPSHSRLKKMMFKTMIEPLKTNNLLIITITIFYLAIIQPQALVNSLLLQDSEPATTTTAATTLADSGSGGETGEGGLVINVPSIKPNDDPANTLDIVQKARKNEISAEMITNKTRAMVSCESGEILVRINFTEPFRGVAYADYDRSSPCKFFGEGANYYEMRLPLKGCGTKQEAPRLFINNIVLRFHRSLELEEDEVKTIVCRYGPPEAPAPPPPPPVLQSAKIVQLEPAKLTQYEPFVIIAGLLFFALALAGVGTTYHLTKKSTIKPINTPFPIVAQTADDFYTTNQTFTTTEELNTKNKLIPLPKLSTQIVDDVFITNIHEIETVEDFVHHRQQIPKPLLERREFDELYITNQEETIDEEVLRQQQLAEMRRLDRLECDDAFITNQDDFEEEENLATQRMIKMPSKLELRTIEDTFITNVDEVVENENTTYLKNHGEDGHSSGRYADDHDEDHYESFGEYRRNYKDY